MQRVRNSEDLWVALREAARSAALLTVQGESTGADLTRSLISAGHEGGHSAHGLGHLLACHAKRDELAGPLGAEATLGGGQTHPLQRLNPAFCCDSVRAFPEEQVLLHAQPVLGRGVA